jgi:mannose-6-phosphate isomerase-like protein (cupin superfamily)
MLYDSGQQVNTTITAGASACLRHFAAISGDIDHSDGNDVMVARLEGPFHWHKHDDTDDFFLVLSGTLDIELRDPTVTPNKAEVFVVPKGGEHRPVARGELHILLIEPTGTPQYRRPGHRRIPPGQPRDPVKESRATSLPNHFFHFREECRK